MHPLSRTLLAAALFASMVSINLTPAYAGTDCGGGNGGENNGKGSPSCDGGGVEPGEGSDPAPLPLAGIPAIITLAAGAVLIRRRKKQS